MLWEPLVTHRATGFEIRAVISIRTRRRRLRGASVKRRMPSGELPNDGREHAVNGNARSKWRKLGGSWVATGRDAFRSCRRAHVGVAHRLRGPCRSAPRPRRDRALLHLRPGFDQQLSQDRPVAARLVLTV